MRKTLKHPFGLTLLIASLVLAGWMFFAGYPWSGRAYWIILLGFLAYAASSAVLLRTPRIQDPTEDLHVEPDSMVPRRIVQEALRQLNKLDALSQCELLPLLPGVLASGQSQGISPGAPGAVTPLEQAQALRELLIAAIEQLKPPGESIGIGAPAALQYHILHEHYVQGRPVAYITTRHNISEANYHLRRRAAIDAVGRQLEAQEGLIVQGEMKS